MAPMIISGLDPEARMNPYLAGYQAQQQLKRSQDAEMAARSARDQQHQDQMREAMLRHKQSQAKALEDANARAQMGEATGMEQQNMEARAQGMPPEQKRLQEMSGVLSKLPEGPARDRARKDFMDYEKQLRDEEQKQAALSIIDTSVNDGHMDGEAAKARLDSGEEPETIAQEAMKIRKERIDANIAIEDSQEAIAQAQQILQSSPKASKGARIGKNILTAFMDSPTAQRKPGAGPEMLKKLKNALVYGEDEKINEAAQKKLKEFKKDAAREPHEPYFFGLAGQGPAMTGGPRGPEGPTPGTHKTLRGLKSGEIKPTKKQDTAPQDPAAGALAIVAQMREAGIPITPETLQAVKARLRGQGAAPAGAQ